jgi:predicted RNA binding protein YcfA (HicA-like mRNA interferase family)
MPKLKPVSTKELIKILKKLNYEFLRQKGSHATYVNSNGKILIVPMHTNKKIDKGLLLKIIKKELNLTKEEFEKLR